MKTWLGVDPGQSTGWCLADLDDDIPLTRVDYGIITGGLQGYLDWIEDNWQIFDDVDEVVIEDFILDGRTRYPDTCPLELIGATIALRHGKPVIRQRNTYKAIGPDALLKRIGWWIPGLGHDRDAERHLIARAMSLKHMPTAEWLFPAK